MCSAILDGAHDVPFAFAQAMESLDFLAQALELRSPEIFDQYVAWLASRMSGRELAQGELLARLAKVGGAVDMFLAATEAERARAYIRSSQTALNNVRTASASAETRPVASGESLSPLGRRILDALLAYDQAQAAAISREAVREGMGMQALYLTVFQPVLRVVGVLWQANCLGVAQEHFASGATSAIMAQLKGEFERAEPLERAMVCACVAGEAHDIGARMLADLFEAAGWRSIFFGANTPGTDLLRTAIEQRAHVMALSCAYAPNLHELCVLVQAVRATPECRALKVMVGGYAFEGLASLWRDVGADAYAPDGAQAVTAANALLAQVASPEPDR